MKLGALRKRLREKPKGDGLVEIVATLHTRSGVFRDGLPERRRVLPSSIEEDSIVELDFVWELGPASGSRFFVEPVTARLEKSSGEPIATCDLIRMIPKARPMNVRYKAKFTISEKKERFDISIGGKKVGEATDFKTEFVGDLVPGEPKTLTVALYRIDGEEVEASWYRRMPLAEGVTFPVATTPTEVAKAKILDGETALLEMEISKDARSLGVGDNLSLDLREPAKFFGREPFAAIDLERLSREFETKMDEAGLEAVEPEKEK